MLTSWGGELATADREAGQYLLDGGADMGREEGWGSVRGDGDGDGDGNGVRQRGSATATATEPAMSGGVRRSS